MYNKGLFRAWRRTPSPTWESQLWPTPWFQPSETLSRESTRIMLGLQICRNCEIIKCALLGSAKFVIIFYTIENKYNEFTLVDFLMLNQVYIPGINSVWSWYILLGLICYNFSQNYLYIFMKDRAWNESEKNLKEEEMEVRWERKTLQVREQYQ